MGGAADRTQSRVRPVVPPARRHTWERPVAAGGRAGTGQSAPGGCSGACPPSASCSHPMWRRASTLAPAARRSPPRYRAVRCAHDGKRRALDRRADRNLPGRHVPSRVAASRARGRPAGIDRHRRERLLCRALTLTSDARLHAACKAGSKPIACRRLSSTWRAIRRPSSGFSSSCGNAVTTVPRARRSERSRRRSERRDRLRQDMLQSSKPGARLNPAQPRRVLAQR